MTTENNEAAQVDPLAAFVQGSIDQEPERAQVEDRPSESATEEEVDTLEAASTDAEKPKEDGFQKRIDKVTADKYAEKRRADDLQKKLDEIETSKSELKKPKLDDPEIDYDEEALERASRDYEIQQGVNESLAKREEDAQATRQKQAQQEVATAFKEQITTLGKADFEAKAQGIPNLPDGVADALMQSEDGAEVIYHLGNNLDKAEAIANMTPPRAMMELGKLSAQLATKPSIKTSAAPDPIKPLGGGGSVTPKSDEEMTMAEFMAKHG